MWSDPQQKEAKGKCVGEGSGSSILPPLSDLCFLRYLCVKGFRRNVKHKATKETKSVERSGLAPKKWTLN